MILGDFKAGTLCRPDILYSTKDLFKALPAMCEHSMSSFQKPDCLIREQVDVPKCQNSFIFNIILKKHGWYWMSNESI